MTIGRDSDIFGEDPTVRVETGGRPAVDRDKALLLLKAEIYTTGQIAQALDCSPRTVRRIREELIEEGKLESDDMKNKKIGAVVGNDFDAECYRTTGLSFRDWLQTKFSSKSTANTCFNFTRRCWQTEAIFNRCSIVRLADRSDRLADQMAVKWLNVFGEDKERIRRRKKMIRFFFRFIGRGDINDRHFTMKRSSDPVAIRELPEITLLSFPEKLEACIEAMAKINPAYEALLKTKLTFMARTGNTDTERGIFGLKKGEGKSWIVMERDEDGGLDIRGRILDKGRITWDINRLPDAVADLIFEVYAEREIGDPIFDPDMKRQINKDFSKVSKAILGRKWKLHDLRKVSATWYFALDVPLEILAMINVGWRDLNTIKMHYLQLRGLLKKSDRVKYAAKIPQWFREDIEEWADQ